MSVKEKGYLTTEEVRALPQYPTEEDFKRGPMAVIECPQEIPCNPCETSCRFNAIHVGKPITTIPQFTGENCTDALFV